MHEDGNVNISFKKILKEFSIHQKKYIFSLPVKFVIYL